MRIEDKVIIAESELRELLEQFKNQPLPAKLPYIVYRRTILKTIRAYLDIVDLDRLQAYIDTRREQEKDKGDDNGI